jgi:hypothetical protein
MTDNLDAGRLYSCHESPLPHVFWYDESFRVAGVQEFLKRLLMFVSRCYSN